MATTTKTVLITGSTRGIGLALATTTQRPAGMSLALLVRTATPTRYDSLSATEFPFASKPCCRLFSQQLTALTPFKVVTMDTSDEASVAKAAAELEGVAIDLVINNAGTGWLMEIVEPTKQLLMNAVEVNAVGPFLVMRALQANLQLAAKLHGAAAVVQISSLLGSITSNTNENVVFFNGQYAYSMSKAALNMITRSLAVNMRGSNVAVVAVHPGYVDTELTGGQGPLKPHDVATAIADIVSKVTIKDTGKFLNADPTMPGVELPW
ncbi:hypothetical protein V7S43_009934 [Phytophthora oleae]|uniref:Short chain dehydrogenase n=1 Tax=Phytophthora oleae TaxID=2107226 RepID=A0ABD3FHX4_9STRA